MELVEGYLDDPKIQQDRRTIAITKKVTGRDAVSVGHAEVLIDAEIDALIHRTGMDAVVPLPNFWNIPFELRLRILEYGFGKLAGFRALEKDYNSKTLEEFDLDPNPYSACYHHRHGRDF